MFPRSNTLGYTHCNVFAIPFVFFHWDCFLGKSLELTLVRSCDYFYLGALSFTLTSVQESGDVCAFIMNYVEHCFSSDINVIYVYLVLAFRTTTMSRYSRSL